MDDMYVRAWIAAAAMLPLAASAGDRLSALTVEQDNQYTALSTIVCKIRASRLTPTRTYSGTMDFEWQALGSSQNGYAVTVPFEVSPAAPTYTEISPGAYEITATLVKGRVLVVMKVPVPLSPDDLVLCNGRIELGARGAPLGLIYAANLRYTDQTH
jgi:hypothetical protein